MNADRSIRLSEIVLSLQDADKFDVVIFNRYADNGNRIPLAKKVASRAFNIIMKALFG
ncbi:MAG: hypothetical protein ACP5UZ_08940 [Thermoplasmata archaeon]